MTGENPKNFSNAFQFRYLYFAVASHDGQTHCQAAQILITKWRALVLTQIMSYG